MSLQEGIVPLEWKEANIVPLFKKGSRNKSVNYRPVSLTSVICKLLLRFRRRVPCVIYSPIVSMPVFPGPVCRHLYFTPGDLFSFIYTIICLKSVCRRSQTAGRILSRSPREMSQTDRIVWQYILSRVRISGRGRAAGVRSVYENWSEY